MSRGSGNDNTNRLDPRLKQARLAANVAHGVLVKFKEMGLPETLDDELASVCTDLGDLWSASKALADRVEQMIESSDDWEALGDSLVDLRSGIDHIAWHLKSVRRPLTRITRYAYGQASENDRTG